MKTQQVKIPEIQGDQQDELLINSLSISQKQSKSSNITNSINQFIDISNEKAEKEIDLNGNNSNSNLDMLNGMVQKQESSELQSFSGIKNTINSSSNSQNLDELVFKKIISQTEQIVDTSEKVQQDLQKILQQGMINQENKEKEQKSINNLQFDDNNIDVFSMEIPNMQKAESQQITNFQNNNQFYSEARHNNFKNQDSQQFQNNNQNNQQFPNFQNNNNNSQHLNSNKNNYNNLDSYTKQQQSMNQQMKYSCNLEFGKVNVSSNEKLLESFNCPDGIPNNLINNMNSLLNSVDNGFQSKQKSKSKTSSQIKSDLNNFIDINLNKNDPYSKFKRVLSRLLPLIKGLSLNDQNDAVLLKKFPVKFNIDSNLNDCTIENETTLKIKENSTSNQNISQKQFVTLIPELEQKYIYKFHLRKISYKKTLKIGISLKKDVDSKQLSDHFNQNNSGDIFCISENGQISNFVKKVNDIAQNKQDPILQQQQEINLDEHSQTSFDIIEIKFLVNGDCQITLKNQFNLIQPYVYIHPQILNQDQKFYLCCLLDQQNQQIEIRHGQECLYPALPLNPKHWLEASDPRHRYGNYLVCFFKKWKKSDTKESFFYWLDIGEGKGCDTEKCSRDLLENTGVQYLGSQQREQHRVIVSKGIFIFKKNWQVVDTTKPLQIMENEEDELEEEEENGKEEKGQEQLEQEEKQRQMLEEDKKWIFVVSINYKMYIHPKIRGKFHHTSFLSGGPVICAGNLIIKNGKLTEIKPHSGHYTPDISHFKRYLSILEKQCGVNMDQVSIGTVKDPTKKKQKAKYV